MAWIRQIIYRMRTLSLFWRLRWQLYAMRSGNSAVAARKACQATAILNQMARLQTKEEENGPSID